MGNPFASKKKDIVEDKVVEKVVEKVEEPKDDEWLEDIKKTLESRPKQEPVPMYPVKEEPVQAQPPPVQPKAPPIPAEYKPPVKTRKVIRRRKPVSKTEPEPKPEPKRITNPEKIKKIKKTVKLRKNIHYFDWNRGLVFFTVLAIMGLIFIYQMVQPVSMALAMILMLFGMLCFLPLGLLLGKLFLDPYVRCKVLRRIRGKNYGMVHFVHKGGQRIDIKIKNLEDDVVVQDTKLWVLEKGGIYYVDREDSMLFVAEIENIVTSPNNVPMLYLDPESMLPLRFHETQTKSNPQQVGATVLGYVNNQIAKNLFFKRSMQTFYTLILVMEAISITVALMIYDLLGGFQ